ncbi:ABC transporter substrate-binding protein, partial [candidate division WOR-3 bacterium]|nr:ABC transporter substrate-binding protein [candidate division WOR-3 bacterium]
PPADGRVVVTFWHAMGGQAQKTLKAMAASFMSSHPGIRIDLVGMGSYDALSQKLMGAVAAQNPPTIAQMYESWTTQLHANGRLEYLDDYLRGPNGLSADDVADIYPVLLANNTWDGRLLTLPFNKSVPVYYYNVELLRAAGYVRFPATWEGFRAMCRRLTVRTGSGRVERWGTAMGTDIWVFGSMLFQAGGRYLDAEDGRPEFAGAAGRQALEFHAGMVLQDGCQSQQNDAEVMNEFLVGRFATLTLSSARRATITESVPFTIGMAPVPVSGRPAAIVYGTNIGMFRSASAVEKAAAWEFIRWFISPEQQAEWSLGTWYVPIHRRCLEDPRIARRLQETPGLRAAYAQMEHAVFEPRGLRWLAGRRALVEELQAATLGAKTPRQALDDAAARYLEERLPGDQ